MSDLSATSTALVVGGGSGIGLEACRELAARGMRVVVADIDREAADRAAAQIGSTGASIESRTVDVTSTASVEELVEESDSNHDLSALVNCAGIIHVGPIAECRDDVWTRVLDVNLTGTMRLCRAVAPRLETRGGSIVNVSSIGGRSTSTYSSAAYVASKAGVIGLTMRLASELAPYDVRVNCVAPGVIDTPMIRDYEAGHREGLARRIPLARLGEAAEVARTIAFLAGPDSSFITGQTIDVNGGQLMTS